VSSLTRTANWGPQLARIVFRELAEIGKLGKGFLLRGLVVERRKFSRGDFPRAAAHGNILQRAGDKGSIAQLQFREMDDAAKVVRGRWRTMRKRCSISPSHAEMDDGAVTAHSSVWKHRPSGSLQHRAVIALQGIRNDQGLDAFAPKKNSEWLRLVENSQDMIEKGGTRFVTTLRESPGSHAFSSEGAWALYLGQVGRKPSAMLKSGF